MFSKPPRLGFKLQSVTWDLAHFNKQVGERGYCLGLLFKKNLLERQREKKSSNKTPHMGRIMPRSLLLHFLLLLELWTHVHMCPACFSRHQVQDSKQAVDHVDSSCLNHHAMVSGSSILLKNYNVKRLVDNEPHRKFKYIVKNFSKIRLTRTQTFEGTIIVLKIAQYRCNSSLSGMK